jgi:predicted MFS family arabinose efflux permease
MLGASLAPRAGRSLGLGRTFIGCVLLVILSYSLILLAHGPVPVALAFLIVQQLFGDFAFAIFNVNELALRQSVAPDDVLGRVNGAMQLMTRGIYPLGALVGGMLAQAVGIRQTLLVAWIGIALSTLWLTASPLRKLRELPARMV